MAGILYDPFQAMPLGPGTPAGWSIPFGGGTVNAGTNNGAYTDHKWYDLNSPGLISPTTPATAAVTLWFEFSFQSNGAQGAFLQLAAPGTSTNFVRLLTLKQESDCTISSYVGGSPDTLISNSGAGSTPFYAAPISGGTLNRWYYAQLNATLSHVTIGTLTFIEMGCDLAIDGTLIMSGTGVSNFNLISQLGTQGVAQVQFSGGNIGLGEVVMADQLAIPAYPQGVWKITVTTAGTGYSPASTSFTITPTSGGAGAAATPVVSTSGTTSGQLLLGTDGALLNAGGIGYITAPTVTVVSTTGGHGAVAVASLVPPPLVRISQGVVEPAVLPSTSQIRIAQAVIEPAVLPSTAQIRIGQMVIELAARFLTASPPPQYIKRFNAPGN